jgi:hypothetical protein
MIIRIDGKEYEAGTPEARSAQVRLDELRNDAFAKEHPELIERNVRTIRNSEACDKIRNDANATALLARDLVFVTAEVERKVYERSRCMQFVRPDTSYPRGAESYSRRLLDQSGEAQVSATLAGDSPRVDVAVSEGLLPFRNIKASYAYSIDDLERAAFSRTPLAAWKRQACIDAIARKIDRIGRSGTALDPNGVAGLTGFFNNAFVTLHTLTNGEWPTATAAEILADLQELEAAIIAAAGDTQPDAYRLILPTVMEGRLVTLEHTAQSDMTVAKFFLANSRLIKSIERWTALDSPTPTVGSVVGDVAATDAPMAILTPMDQVQAGIEWPMPIAYEEMPPEIENFEWVVNARARVGGVEFVRPYLSMYVQNLD